MRILISVTSYLSYRLIEGQISYLTSNGIEVYFSSSFSEKVKDAVEREGGIFCPIEIEREISLINDFKSVIKAFKLLKKIEPDIINVSTPKASLVFCLASNFYKKSKLIFTLRGLRSDTLEGLKYRIVKFTEYFCCKMADKVIPIAPSLSTDAIQKGILKENKSIVIGKGSSNGINLNRFTISDNKKEYAKSFRKKYNICYSDIVFGYVGRLVKDKGIIELYEAFNELRKKYSKIKLLLVGTFEDGDSLSEKLINSLENDSNVIILNYVERIENIFPVMDCFVLYSYREGFGNVSIEAASMNIPVIVSDIPGLKDTIQNNETGLLAKPKNANDLYDKMSFLLENSEKRKEFGRNGRERIIKYFNRDLVWDSQLHIYKNLLREN